MAAPAGCNVGYYWQAAGGQMEIVGKRRPIQEVLEDGEVDEETKVKLRLVLSVQQFGVDDMSMPEDGLYTLYADLERPYVTWLVVASERFAVRAVEQCYLFVGCLDYRGYFEREDAEEFAQGLREDGKDARVRPVRAYSTLGWFDDPVLNTFLDTADVLAVVGTILHEQAHRVLFVKGDTSFNESFASFVEREGVVRFIRHRGDRAKLLARHDDQRADQARFRAIVKRGRERLEKLYRSEMAPEAMADEKARLFERMRRDYQIEKNSFRINVYDSWFDQPLNNAHLVSIQLYSSRVGAFSALFQENGADFSRFFEAARELGELPRSERNSRLEQLEMEDAARSEHGNA